MSEFGSNSRLDSMYVSSGEDVLDDEMDDFEDEVDSSSSTISKKKWLGVTAGARLYFEKYMNRTPCYDREYSGWAALMSILNGNDTLCHNHFRMHKAVFYELCALLVNQYGLKSIRGISVEEQLAYFMMVVGVREGNRQLQEMFQRSGFTISRSFHNVVRSCTKMAIDWVKPFKDLTSTHGYIRDNRKYFPHFKDCIGAIDGTHVKATIPSHLQIPFIGRKGKPTQNVMAACDFDMCFTYVLPGWEGSAHDTRIFYSTIRDPSKKFPMPPIGKYYLVDAGYPNILGFLSPYKGQKYHIPDFNRAISYTNHFEAFNHVHSSLRSVIERSFGVWKSKFQIMDNMPVNIKWQDQVALVAATMAIHNFIRRTDADDDDFLHAACNPNSYEDNLEAGEESNANGETQPSDGAMDKLRDDIC